MNKKKLKELEQELAKNPCGCFVFSCAGDLLQLKNHDLKLFQDPELAEQFFNDIEKQGLPCSWGCYAITYHNYYMHPFEGEEFFVVALNLFIDSGFLSIGSKEREIEDEVSALFCAFADLQDDDDWIS